MLPELVMQQGSSRSWKSTVAQIAIVWMLLFAATFEQWAQMFHQWWNIDTYSHILLIPPIIASLVWLKRDVLAGLAPLGWWPGLVWSLLGLSLWTLGRAFDVNLFAQTGTLMAFQGVAVALLGLRVSLLLALPIAYSSFLVPFGDEIIPQLQSVTAHLATWLTELSGIAMIANGIYIDTPAGLFIVAEACSGVKFLIAMVTLGVLVIFACFESWTRRAWFMLACILVPIIANGVRAWATIFIAQYVGADAAGSFDHIIYGWVFFGLVIAVVLGFAWRWFERDPEDAGWTLTEIENLSIVAHTDKFRGSSVAITVAAVGMALTFVALAQLG